MKKAEREALEALAGDCEEASKDLLNHEVWRQAHALFADDLRDLIAALDKPETVKNEWPQCTGDFYDCPENEGYGCCKANQNAP